jgi:hypothetical protein
MGADHAVPIQRRRAKGWSKPPGGLVDRLEANSPGDEAEIARSRRLGRWARRRGQFWRY